MKIELSKSAVKDLKNIQDPHRKHIEKKIYDLLQFPEIPGIKKLTEHHPAYRLRVGNYRILFDVEIDTIFVGRILHRKEAYR